MSPVDGFRGELIEPQDERFDDARALFNAMIDRRPALIAQCADADDVARAIAYARAASLPLAVRAGGHSVAGMSLNDGGVVVDVRSLNDVSVDPERRTARVGGGATWAEFDAAAQEHGLATTGGRVSSTGVAGLTLGGGSGWLERSYGLSCDNLIGAELVTADGERIRTDNSVNPDLLWALRGGGGNFGVVTALEFTLHPVGPTLFAGLAIYDPARGRDLGRAFRDFHSPGPDAAGLALVYLTAPPEEFVPEAWHGKRVTAIAGCWNGPVEEGEQALRPLIDLCGPLVDLFGPMPYTEFQAMIDDPPGYRNWWTAEYVAALPDEAIDVFCDYSELTPLGPAQSLLVPWGGAVARGGADSVLAKRDAAYVIHPFALWEDSARDEECISWGRGVRKAFAEWTTGGTYLNFIGDEGDERVRAAFGPGYDRLAEVKAHWDPDNVFHGNQNIRPAGSPSS